jgi:ribosomal protein L37E
MRSIINKIRFLIYCHYKGHRFGTTKYEENAEIQVCARCGYRKRRKYRYVNHDDFFIY